MDEFKIFFKKSVEKDLKGIPKKYLTKIFKRIEMLKENPRPEGSEKLTGKELYRIRQGIYRIVYSVQESELVVWVIKVGHRKGIYKHIS